KKSSDKSSGFLYCVSLTGVTGMRKTLPKGLAGFVKKVKKTTGLPVAVGFGISQPSQAKEIANVADGVIIGSALINLIDSYKRLKQQQQALKKLFADIKRNLKKER
ncbi:MAG: tryptophan synthase subunit alpha, partial [Actinomycetia bacterium]|nr:tryptophan synthase subunit alpha [Actinomycetes bacterium]